MKGNRVVVTGMGAVTPLGLDVSSSWEGICAGRSGAATITQFDASAFTTRFSASVKDFSVEGYLETEMRGAWILLSSSAWWPVFRHSEIPARNHRGQFSSCRLRHRIGDRRSWLHRRDGLAH